MAAKKVSYRGMSLFLFINSMTALCIEAHKTKSKDLEKIIQNIVFDFECMLIDMLPKTAAGKETLFVFQFNVKRMYERTIPTLQHIPASFADKK